MISITADKTRYQRMVEAVRLTRPSLEHAKRLQKLGWTFREIAQALSVSPKAVENSMYWDVLAK